MKYFIVIGVLIAVLAVGHAQNEEDVDATVDPSGEENSPVPSPSPPLNRPIPFGYWKRLPGVLPFPQRPLGNIFRISQSSVSDPNEQPGADTISFERIPVAFIFGLGAVTNNKFGKNIGGGSSYGGNAYGDTNFGQGIVVGQSVASTTTTTAAPA